MFEKEEDFRVEKQNDQPSKKVITSLWETRQFSTSSNRLLEEIQQRTSGADLLKLMQILYGIHNDYSNIIQKSRVAGADKPENLFQALLDFLQQHRSTLKLTKYRSNEWASIVISITTIPNKPPVIVGRMFLIAALLHEFDTVFQQLNNSAEWRQKCKVLIEKLDKELEQTESIHFESFLTAKGHEKHVTIFDNTIEKKVSKEDHDSLINTPNLSDAPSKDDQLSRKSLAEHLAKRIRFLYDRDIANAGLGSYFVHIDGAWGSGKSTLLGFLEETLKNKAVADPKIDATKKSQQGWIVVKFNAWEHQRLAPPWWFLMKTVHQEAMNILFFKKKKKIKASILWLREHVWRLNTGTNYLLATILTLALFIITLILRIKTKADFIDFPIVQTGSFILFLWTLTSLFRKSLVSGSSLAAKNFIDVSGRDPLNKLSKHFIKQIDGIEYPVAVFIDDLDRCNKEYGILLMEGLQTIFKKASIVYVIAADSKWLSTIYENQYVMFKEVIAKPAKPFGLIFLDKIFQMRIELPDISATQKKLYWESLLNRKSPEQRKITIEQTEIIKKEVLNAVSVEEKFKIIDREKGNPVVQQRAREVLLSSLSVVEEERSIENILLKFVDLIEPNPRAMKRLINDISMAKAMSILYDQHVEQEQLILWIILKQRYPVLAEFFWKNPDAIDNVLSVDTNIPELNDLLKKPDVKMIFDYTLGKKKVKIDTKFLRKMKFID